MNYLYKTVTILAFLVLISFQGLLARQIVLQDNFEDEDLTQNPVWTGDVGDYTFVQENGNTLLRLNAAAGDRSEISTLSPTAYGSWEFYVRVPATSTQNRVYVYLMSDSDLLDIIGAGSPGNANGYAIHTGNGNFELVRLNNGNSTSLLNSNTTITANQGYQVRVSRNQADEWHLWELNFE